MKICDCTTEAETITAASTRHAWEIAGEILGADYSEDTASTARNRLKDAERERDEAIADRDRIAEELRELKNKLFRLSLVSA